MRSSVAVIAHHSFEDGFSDEFSSLVSIFAKRVELVVVVSTAMPFCHGLEFSKNVRIVFRPNLGYDFVSYRVGLDYIHKLGFTGFNLFLVNSSFIVVESSKIVRIIETTTLRQYSSEGPVVGLTESTQFQRHLQSYFLFFPLEVLAVANVIEFLVSFEIQSTKWDVISKYEIGLSQFLLTLGIELESVFTPDSRTKTFARIAAYKNFLLENDYRTDKKAIIGLAKNWEEINYLQFAPLEVLAQTGIVKTEVIQKNPKNVVLGGLEALKGRAIDTHPGLDYKLVRIPQTSGNPSKVAVVIHLFHLDLYAEILVSLLAMPEAYDLFITTPFEGHINQVISTLPSNVANLTVLVIANRGRDIRPFMTLAKLDVFRDFDVVLKLHTKKSDYSSLGDAWRKSLLYTLLPNAAVVQEVITSFRHGVSGISAGVSSYLTNGELYWGANETKVAQLRGQLTTCQSGQGSLGFFAGSMFWFSPRILSSYVSSKQEFEFEAELGQLDGTMAHAFERVFCDMARSVSLGVRAIENLAVELTAESGMNNKLAV